MAKDYVLAIDQGTTGTRVLVVNAGCQVVGEGYDTHQQHYPQPGWVEHQPTEIWESLKAATLQALSKASVRPEEIAAVGLDNQGETVLLWDSDTGVPLHPAVVWSCRRSESIASEWLQDKEWESRVRQKTGLTVDPYFSATKIKWLLEQSRHPIGKIRCGTLDSWLLYQLSGGSIYATDYSTASRTLMLDIHELGYWQEALDYLGIPSSILPPVYNTNHFFGMTDPKSFLGIEAPILINMVDQPAALYGQFCNKPGMMKCTYGTGCFVLMHAGNQPIDTGGKVLSSIGWKLGDETSYILDGGVYSAGSSVNWAVAQLGLAENVYSTQEMARSVPDTAGVVYVPALTGLASPYWESSARGSFLGLNPSADRRHLIRAILEGVANRVADIVINMKQFSKLDSLSLKVDGGMVKNEFLLQFQADILDQEVVVSNHSEATAFGVALLLGQQLGWWDDLSPVNPTKPAQIFEPRMKKDQRVEIRDRWQKAISATLQFQ